MSTAFTRDRDAKKAAKKAKKQGEKEEKERAQQAKVDEEFAEKQAAANAAADPIGKIKAWCSKPPYLDLTNNVKVSKALPLSLADHVVCICLENMLQGNDHEHGRAEQRYD